MRIRAKTGEAIERKLSLAYWPEPGHNDPADHEVGDAAVDGLTLGQLSAFFEYCRTGPTYCLVKDRVFLSFRLILNGRDWGQEKSRLLSGLQVFHSQLQEAIQTCEERVGE